MQSLPAVVERQVHGAVGELEIVIWIYTKGFLGCGRVEEGRDTFQFSIAMTASI